MEQLGLTFIYNFPIELLDNLFQPFPLMTAGVMDMDLG